MLTLKVFCFCMPPRKASLALGCAGIIISIMMIVPPCLILENHDFYFNEYISRQKSYADSGKTFTLKSTLLCPSVPSVLFFNSLLIKESTLLLVL